MAKGISCWLPALSMPRRSGSTGSTVQAIVARVLSAPASPISALRPSVTASVVADVLRAVDDDALVLVHAVDDLDVTGLAFARAHFAAFHDAVFANQDSMGIKPLSDFAVQAAVSDLEAFEDCL